MSAINPHDHLGLAWIVAGEWADRIGRPVAHELVGIAYEILHGCARRYDPALGNTFAHYALTSMRYYYRDAFCQWSMTKRSKPGTTRPPKVYALQAFDDNPDPPRQTLLDRDLLALLDELPPNQLAAIEARVLGTPMQQLADELGITTAEVYNEERRALRELRRLAGVPRCAWPNRRDRSIHVRYIHRRPAAQLTEACA